jgi:hypothetical protein
MAISCRVPYGSLGGRLLNSLQGFIRLTIHYYFSHVHYAKPFYGRVFRFEFAKISDLLE